ncbi:oligopeptide/dipeptide ABC transporter ATP-binding protein [uncultured Anaerococcus sp.]|uniref:oligopeptide/dipeptide ABC transporter ATP-binding protein n=1 Tax=uncultured Anaerococcus sp. TaxID=293428 RepID=UPI002620EFFF|nr:oligopeptide/dipeptide ABC transporter ATP-binding protein [uncultured Anaerococcus sp.]
MAESDDIYENPLHPYTKTLPSAIPIAEQEEQKSKKLEGYVPSSIDIGTGCSFVDRCPYAIKECSKKDAPIKEVKAGHFVACIRGSDINNL